MASFHQFSSKTPEVIDDRRFLIVKNEVLNIHDILSNWTEYILLIVGASVFTLGFISVLTRITYIYGGRWARRVSGVSNRVSRRVGLNKGSNLVPGWGKNKYVGKRAVPDLSTSFGNVKSFSFHGYDALDDSSIAEDGKMHILSINGDTVTNEVLSRAPTPGLSVGSKTPTLRPSSLARETSSIFLGSVDLSRLSLDVPKARSNEVSLRTSLMNDFRLEQGLHGLILCHGRHDTPYSTHNVLREFRQQLVPIILQADADSDLWDSLDYNLVDGVVVENACLLRSGERRDFFRASRVRDCAAQCKHHRETRPGFFFGFLETLDRLPSAATLRRAHKLADFFSAVLEIKCSIDEKPLTAMPLSAFDALKNSDIAWLQKTWSACSKFAIGNDTDPTSFDIDISPVEAVIPDASAMLYQRDIEQDWPMSKSMSMALLHAPDYVSGAPRRRDIWEFASCGTPLTRLGCFPLREEITEEQYSLILRMQKSLKERRMLQLYGDAEVLRVSESLKELHRTSYHSDLLRELLNGMIRGDVKIFAGLDSGFNLPDAGGHLWGIADDFGGQGPKLDIHISLKAPSDVAAIWHIFLAHRGVPRLQRFEEEKLLNTDESVLLPVSLVKEIEQSAESELLYLMQQIQISDTHHPFHEAINDECQRILVSDTSRRAWTSLHSKACLDSSISIRSLLEQRLTHFAELGVKRLPELDGMCRFVRCLEVELERALLYCDREALSSLSTSLQEVYGHAGDQYAVTPMADLYGLMYFCVLRRLAFENVYLETTDRCPLFLSQPDQAAVFSELWVLGSQCEIYFGLLPRALGEITYTRYRQHLVQYPPPVSSWDGKEVFTAYSTPPPRLKNTNVLTGNGSGMVPTESPEEKAENPRGPPKPAKYKTAFKEVGAFSIFCFPAIVDVTLLSFLGRGLYLTSFMDEGVKRMTDYAILTSLILTGGVTGWVGSSGGFYLFNFAFDNMAHFLIHRFSGALMLTSAVAFCGFIAFGAQFGWFNGFVFVLYLYPLSIFLTLLGIFATMHRNDSPLPSGRTSMWKLLPILLISPVLTTFVHGYDLLIYLLIVYTFTFSLIWEFRRLCHEWTDWHLKVPSPLKEGDLLKWYKARNTEHKELDTLQLASAARSDLHAELFGFAQRKGAWFKSKPKPDPFVSKIADGLPEAMFLLRKECGASELPEMFTTTWFVQLELALNNQRQLMRGLREHSAFISYRYSRYDIGQNVGLFLAALLDRLIQVVMSARNPQPNAGLETDLKILATSRYAICFALLHFLSGALSVDVVLQRYWAFASKVSTKRLGNITDLHKVLDYEERQRQSRYWRALGELMGLLSISFGVFTIFVWLFVNDTTSIVMYFAYISSYTAVLLCQFHRCFTKSHRLHVLVVFGCCMIGFSVGVILRIIPATAAFNFDFVIGQNVACVSAAIGTAVLIMYNPNTKVKSLDAAENEFKSPARSNSIAPVNKGHSACGNVHQANQEILEHVCLGLDVNTEWARLPEDVRRLVIGRVLGQSAPLSGTAQTWIQEKKISIQRHDANLTSSLTKFDKRFSQLNFHPSSKSSSGAELTSVYTRKSPNKSILFRLRAVLMEALDGFTKWTAIISGGTPDTPRELWYALRDSRIRFPVLWALLKVWKVCWWFRIMFVQLFVITGKQPLGSLLDLIYHGARRTLRGNTITVNTPSWKVTGFVIRSPLKQLGIIMYEGLHTKAPEQKRPIAVAFYDAAQRLRRRQEIRGPNAKPIETNYHYDEKSTSRWPVSKTTVDASNELRTNYDYSGRPVSGEVIRGSARFEYQYFYKKGAAYDSEVLHASYKKVDGGAHMSISVFWCVRPRTTTDDVRDWIASDKVQSVLAVLDGQTYEVKWIYKHAQGADIEASVLDSKGKRRPCLPPAQILENKFNFLNKPKNVGFDYEDILVYHPVSSLSRMCRHVPGRISKTYTFITSMPPLRWFRLGEKVVFHKLPTATLRTALWNAWGKAPFVDAVTASCLDEMILRKEPLLSKYWSLRDAGYLSEASCVLDENLEQIISAMEPSHESSEKCPLLIKSADLFTMGLGKDATQLTARLDDAYRDTEKTTSVIFSDNGCWPDNPGGVSNCRRDLVNGHTTIRGHCLAESANDFGIPRYQIERNINTLKVLPLWGLDGKTAHHGLFDNLLQTQVDNKITATKNDEDIRQVFIPLLKAFILGARSKRYTREDLTEYSNVMLKMNRYFETCDYNKTWNSELVWRAWLDGWLHEYNDPNVRSPSECFDLEQPSLSDFRDALNLYICYFFIYSVQMPEDCPKVFQSTHHGISSLFGMLLKYRRGTTWGLWDHAILWRETCLNISPAQCLLPLPVQSMLLAGVKLACHLAYTHVDIVLPCTSVFNPDWEADLGTDQGLRGSKKLFDRKIDPIVNGIGNMDSFQPVEEIRSKLPTTVMLSNVQFIKDVKTAVLAADVIINKYGFKDYRLIIYGAQDRQPSYALETVNLINGRGLAGKVILGGFGSPKEVLKDAWLFVNSSLSEGLPLAIGEAALSGVPIVATEVGATSLVLTDPDNSSTRYGEVVPPNDPESLARAQLSILSMSGPWAKYTKSGESCKLPDVFDSALVEQYTKRMYTVSDDRRALGLKLREVVLRSFHGHRYLREHEQMYWVQRRRAEIRRSPMPVERHPPINEVYGEKRIFQYDWNAGRIPDARRRWQLFETDKLRERKNPVDTASVEAEPEQVLVELGEK